MSELSQQQHGPDCEGPDEDLANEMAALIYERSQMTQGDADDLAWDLLAVVKSHLADASPH